MSASSSSPAVPFRRTLRWCVGTMALLFLVFSAIGYVALIASQMNKHAQTILEDYTGQVLWMYGRVLIGYLGIGALMAIVLHPVLPGRKSAWGAAGLTLLALLYTLTSGTHLLFGPVHSAVAAAREAIPDVVRGLYRPWQPLAAMGALCTWSALCWARRLPGRWTVGAGVVVLAVLVWKHWPYSAAAPRSRAPNLLLITTDSLRADHLGCNGYGRPTSPHIDALAARGTNFQHCLVPTASTHESWISLLSSTHPRTNGLRHMFPSRELVRKVETEQTYLTRMLRERGYKTAVVGGWCGSTFELFDLGIDRVDVSDAQNVAALAAEAAFTNHLAAVFFLNNPLGRALVPELKRVSFFRAAPELTDLGKRTLDELARDGDPFCLILVYHGTHLPYSSTFPYYHRFTDPDYAGRNRYRVDFQIDEMIQRGFDHDLSPEEQAHIVALYDGCVREFDDQVGALVEHLRERGLEDRTIVGVWADHGDDLYEHGTTLGHGVTLFGGDQANHVPAVFAGPGVPVGRVESGLCRSYDLTPTLARWLELPVPSSWEGVDLSNGVPALTALLETSYLLYRQPVPDLGPWERVKEFPKWDDATFIDHEFDDNFVLRDRFLDALVETKCFAVREGRYKLIRVPGRLGRGLLAFDMPIVRLFDLEEDPQCRRNLAFERPEILRRLLRKLPPEARVYGE